MKKRKVNPTNRNGLIQTRVNNKEMYTIIQKAFLENITISEFVRKACLEYKSK